MPFLIPNVCGAKARFWLSAQTGGIALIADGCKAGDLPGPQLRRVAAVLTRHLNDPATGLPVVEWFVCGQFGCN
jgi:hypothetical protein